MTPVVKLWAPWRKAYILGKKSKGCFLCRIRRSNRDRANHVIARSTYSFAVLNRYPYNNGHVMATPNRHVKSLAQLASDEQLDLLKLTCRIIEQLEKKMKPDGINLGVNFGRAAGAGLIGHLHVHLVPRWKSDTNFMPVTANTKVISEALTSVYQKLSFQ
ncbi:MAG: HIT family hydrolase [Omnitrophica bacterium RIFCSPLOWO2_12_FULL_50_11]|nr:MAG: HIT family hydrolase [Omnitrophica bacterium RIFCSPLOWO2_12_FULL_50_11]